MEENEAQRRAERAEREREALETVAAMKRAEEEDQAAAEEKRKQKAEFRAAVLADNQAAIRAKRERREAEIAEERALEE